jgi:hypothetical protein
MFGGQSSKTTVLIGLRGTAAFQDDLRWADVFSKQGAGFVLLDGPAALPGGPKADEETKKVVAAVGKANLLLIASGLDPAQNRLVFESAGKPLFLLVNTPPGADILELVKKTKSAIGLVLGKDEDPAAYFKKLDAAKKVVGAENLSIVTENCLWGKPGREQMFGLIGELLKAKYESEDLANLFSGAFMSVLERARTTDAARPSGFMPF